MILGSIMLFKFLTYNKFKYRKWKKLSYEKRAIAYQELENIQAKKQKRTSYRVVIKDLEENIYGRCVSSERVILLDIIFVLNIDKRFMGMSVLFHEGRHAFQYETINDPRKLHPFSKAYKWKKNFEGYVYGDEKQGDKYSFYSMQPVERDAELHAVKQLKKLKFKYRKDTKFLETLEKEEKSYDLVKEKAKKELGVFFRIRVAFRNWKQRIINRHKK